MALLTIQNLSLGYDSKAIIEHLNLTVNAGSMAAYSSDDAINSAGNMVISGGYIYCYSTGNDGLDANGNLTINGGVVIACGTTSPEEGIDAAEGKTLSINGGTVIGIGGGSEATSGSQLKASLSGISVSGGAYLTVKDAWPSDACGNPAEESDYVTLVIKHGPTAPLAAELAYVGDFNCFIFTAVSVAFLP